MGKFIEVFVPGGTGGFMPVHGEAIELPEPFRVGPGTVPLAVEFAMPGALQGEAKGDLPGPFPGFSVSCAFGMACTLLGQTAWLSGGAQILCEVTKWDDEGNPLEWWYPYAGGGLVWMLDAQAFGLRQTINTPGLDGKRNIPLLEGMPEPAGLLDEVDAVTYDGHGVKLYLDKSKSFGALHYMPSLRPLRTDVDMEITGMDTFGDSKRQQCAPYFIDVAPGTKVAITCRLPGLPEGFQGLNADRTVYLSYPEGCFTSEEPSGQTKKGNEDFIWHLTRTEAHMEPDAVITGWSDSIPAGHPDTNRVSIGGMEIRPAAMAHSSPGDNAETTANKVLDITNCKIRDHRTSYPAEGGPFLLLPSEHFEILGTFEFVLDGAGKVVPPSLRYEVWDTDWTNDLLQKGAGLSFTRRWGAAAADKGDVFVRFYLDRNNNGKWDDSEPEARSAEFRVQQLEYYPLKIQYSSLLGGGMEARITSRIATARAVVLMRDSDEDFRACAWFHIESIGPFTPTPPGGARPDPCEVTKPGAVEGHFAACDITFLDALSERNYPIAGICGSTWHDIIVDWWSSDGSTIAHEIGHGVGLYPDRDTHNQISDKYIMWNPKAPNMNHLTQEEADAYD